MNEHSLEIYSSEGFPGKLNDKSYIRSKNEKAAQVEVICFSWQSGGDSEGKRNSFDLDFLDFVSSVQITMCTF